MTEAELGHIIKFRELFGVDLTPLDAVETNTIVLNLWDIVLVRSHAMSKERVRALAEQKSAHIMRELTEEFPWLIWTAKLTYTEWVVDWKFRPLPCEIDSITLKL